jgi:hypothetical protein
MEASPGANASSADASPPPAPGPLPPPVADAPPPDRKRSRAQWAADEFAANARYKQEAAADGTGVEGEVQITVLSERGRVLCDVDFDLRQGAGTLFGTLFGALDQVGKADFMSAYDFTYQDSRGRKRNLADAADYETFVTVHSPNCTLICCFAQQSPPSPPPTHSPCTARWVVEPEPTHPPPRGATTLWSRASRP